MTKKTDDEPGDQLMLMDIHTEEAKKILAKVKAYKKVQKVRMAALADETAKKQELLALVHGLEYKPNAEGIIKFGIEDTVIKVTPSKETISVKINAEE